MLTALLSVLGIQSAQAQAVQDALYIYRNDGGFNAFFFDDIERFEYSNIDTLGIEHDEMVVQEVYALDTLYRIPLSAIDSIGFVTPETIFKKDVAHTSTSEMWNYVVGSDSSTVLLLSDNTPKTLIPKVGDKIVTTDSRDYLPGGFYGRVNRVDDIAGSTLVICEIPELTDLFDQWVCKAALVGTPESATRGATRFSEESYVDEWDLPFYGNDFDLRQIEGISYSLNDNWSLEGSGRLKYGIANHVYIRVFGMLRATLGVNFDMTARLETSALFDLSVKGKCSGGFDFTFTPGGKPLKKWIPKSPCFIEFEVGWSMSVSGEPDLKIEREYKSSRFVAAAYNDSFYERGDGMVNTHSHSYAPVSKTALSGKAEATAGFYASLGVSTIDKKIAYLGVRADLGLRAKADAEIRLTDFLLTALPGVLPIYMMSSPTALYDELNRDGSISFGPFFKSQGEFSIGKYKKPFLEYDNKADTTFLGGLVPKFADTEIKTEGEKPNQAYVGISRRTLFNPAVGFALYYTKSGKKLGDTWWKTQSFNPDKLKEYTMDLPKFGGGKEVRVFPVVKLLNLYELLGSPYASYTVPAKLESMPEKLTFDAKGGEETLTVTDNLDRNEDSYIDEYGVTIEDKEEKWLSVKKENGTYTISAKPNTTAQERSGSVDFYVFNEDRSVDLTLKVPVMQKAPEYEFTVSPEALEVAGYSKDFNGGELTQQMTVKYPNTAKSIKVSSSEESWLTVDDAWAGKTIDDINTTATRKIHIKPNFNLESSRDGVITVELTDADGAVATRTLAVKQSALNLKVELEPTELTLTAEEKPGAKYSNKATVNIKMDPTDSYISSAIQNRDAEPSVTWIEASVKDDIIEVRAEANPDETERTATLTYTITMKDGGRLSKTIKVTQLAYQVIKAFTFSPETVRLTAQGGEKKVYVVGEDVEKITEIDCLSSSWLGGAASGLSMTLSAKPNEGKEERVGTVYITALMKDGTVAKEYLLVYQDGNGSSVEPGPGPDPSGDSSPFKRINFWVERNVQYVSDDENTPDTLFRAAIGVNFEAKNTHFTWSEDKKTMHVECQGYIEKELNNERTNATLSFDIDKTNNMVKNLQFSRATSANVFHMHWLGYDIIEDGDFSTVVALGDFPLQTNSRTYKEGKWTVADGLEFKNWTNTADLHGYYVKTADIIDLDMPDKPYTSHVSYNPTGDASDYVWLIISMKEQEEEEEVPLEWPDAATMQQLKSNGLPVHEGNNPPTVNGTYLMSPLSIVSDNTGAGGDMESLNGLVMKFSSQADGQLNFDYYFITEGEADYANGESKALIQGDGSKFSICAPWKDSFFIISGDISNGTVSDMHCAIASHNDTDNPLQYAIIKDDGNSTNTTWEPMPDDN
jgi:hypothetical protein